MRSKKKKNIQKRENFPTIKRKNESMKTSPNKQLVRKSFKEVLSQRARGRKRWKDSTPGGQKPSLIPG